MKISHQKIGQPFVLCCLLIVLGQWSTNVRADNNKCPAIKGAAPKLASLDAEERLQAIQQAMDPASRRALAWALGWGIGYGVMTVGQFAPIPWIEDDGLRADFYVGGSAAALGVLFIAVAPPNVIRDKKRLDEKLAARSEQSDVCVLLAETERAVLDAARFEQLGTSWIIHGANLLLNVGAGLILGFAFNRWDSAFLTTSTGTLIGEIMIWTQPMDMTEFLERYRKGILGVSRDKSATLNVGPLIRHNSLGLAAAVRF